MLLTEIRRPSYYEGQYLGAQDLLAAQEYQRQQDQRHRLAAHTWGIAAGLELEERLKPGGGTAVEVYLRPGYAVDGFGRAMAVLEPYKVPDAMFAQYLFDSVVPEGRWVPVWLRYHEEKAGPPRLGFGVCDSSEQSFGVSETFRLVIGELTSTSLQSDPISVAGKLVNAASEKIPDASIPYQALPDAKDRSRWLIRLGSVRWLGPNPPATTIGHFVKTETDPDKLKAREGRPYLGVVAESVLGPSGKVRIRDRLKAAIPANETSHLAAVEGSLRIDEDIYVRGSVGVRTPNPEQALSIQGGLNIDQADTQDGTLVPGKPFAGVTFGSKSGEGIASKRTPTGNQFGLDFYTANTPRLSITKGGNVGIGTSTPEAGLKLDIQGEFGRKNQASVVHLWSSQLGDTGQNTLFIRGGVGLAGGGIVKFDASKIDMPGNLFVGSITNLSDERLKANIVPLGNVLERIRQIRGCSYEWNETGAALGYSSGKKQIGVLAQEVDRVFPELVTRWGEQNYLGLDYTRFAAVLLEALKDLATQNEALARRIEALENTWRQSLEHSAQTRGGQIVNG